MAQELGSPVKFTWINVAILVACVVVANVLVGAIAGFLPLPGIILTAIGAAIGVFAWFIIVAAMAKRNT